MDAGFISCRRSGDKHLVKYRECVDDDYDFQHGVILVHGECMDAGFIGCRRSGDQYLVKYRECVDDDSKCLQHSIRLVYEHGVGARKNRLSSEWRRPFGVKSQELGIKLNRFQYGFRLVHGYCLESGKDMVKNVGKGISDAFQTALDTVKNIWKGLSGWFEKHIKNLL